MTLKQLSKLPNTVIIKPSSIELRLIANRDQYGKHAIELYLKKPNNKINLFSMVIIDGWAYEVLDIILDEFKTVIVIKML